MAATAIGGQWLTDEAGVKYLDTRNNVCHVGHAHPAVAKAVSQQVAVLNTNTRSVRHCRCPTHRFHLGWGA